MRFLQSTNRRLSPKGDALVQFDRDSLRQIVASKSGVLPDLWLYDPDLYEKDGRLLRDSTMPRLLAYSSEAKTLYVTDGCNSCAHPLAVDLANLSASELEEFSAKTSIRLDLLQRLASETLKS